MVKPNLPQDIQIAVKIRVIRAYTLGLWIGLDKWYAIFKARPYNFRPFLTRFVA